MTATRRPLPADRRSSRSFAAFTSGGLRWHDSRKGDYALRVIHSTPRSAAGNIQPPDDAIIDGFASFEAVYYEPGENIPPGEHPQLVSYWLSRLKPNADLIVSPGNRLRGPSPAAIPRGLLERLHPEGKLDLRWHWTRKR